MKTNEQLQTDVENAIKWEPLLNAAEIGVTAKNGIITLTGTVNSFAKKNQAETAAKNVAGVKTVAESIQLNFGNTNKKSDTEIAQEILNAWKWNFEVPEEKIQVKVEYGWVTLEGELKWYNERKAAAKSVEHLLGVTGVSNNITIKSGTQDIVEKIDIQDAFTRSWTVDDENITVTVKDNQVTLT